MSRVIVIGACGHIGTYLVPRLLEAGHHVVTVSGRRHRLLVQASSRKAGSMGGKPGAHTWRGKKR